MKPLKFKFWCKGTSSNLNFDKPGWWSYPNFLLDKYYANLDILESEDFVPCQFAGLFDKTGKEIYEGDIVKGKFFDTDYMGDVLVTCPVNWVEENACFNIGNRHWSRSSIKVIGNIFENPELLELP
jgi:hypothetical protein